MLAEELLDTNLIHFIKPYSIKIEKAFEQNEKESLEEIVNSIEQDSIIIKEIKKIKQNEIIKNIEMN